jgi:peptidyl-prolyl cis-trans isomerase C
MNGRTWKIGGLAARALACLACLVGRSPAQAPDPPPTGVIVPVGTAVATTKPAAVVNGEAIPMSDLEAVLKQAGPSAVSMPEEQRRAAQRQALAMLIDETLMHQFLMHNAPAVSEAEVDKKLAEMDAGLRKEKRSLADFFREVGVSEAQARNDIAFKLRWHAYALQNVSDAMVVKYYTEFKDFFDDVQVKASHIVMRVPPTAPAPELQAAREKLTALREQIIAGKLDFAEAAKKNSQCPSAPGGGDIGYFKRKWVVDEEFAKVAFALKIGDVSDIVQSEYGLHLIKVTDRKPGQTSDFAKIKEDVREFCTEEVRQSLLARMRKEAKIEVNLP